MRSSVSLVLLIALGACLPDRADWLGSSVLEAQSIEQAERYHAHGLNDDAKRVLVGLLEGDKADTVKARALYSLGQISFEEGKYQVAISDWEELIKRFPSSTQAADVNARLAQLREAVTSSLDNVLSNAVASSYLKNGDFWSDAERTFTIDVSWLPKVELATAWYDRMISEFPGAAAEVGYQRKLSTLLGWKEPGQYGDSYGVRDDFKQYMPEVLATFAAFEGAFPQNSTLQAYRYQIAQAYWSKKDWANTRAWLQKVIEAGGGTKSFYTQTAQARLQKVEY